MRNLKKVLSLALALVMMLGMMVVGAGAAEYTDAGDIATDYKAAADVTGAINVIRGRTGDVFDPKAELTRAEGAAIIYRLIMSGMDKAPAATPTGFVDVDGTSVGSWAGGYITACASQDIISGVDPTHFDPDGKLSGYAFAKMLLVALGYNPDVQGYTGNSWSANVFRDAYTAGLTVSGLDMLDNMTREQAAQMTLQALQATMVDQTGNIAVNGVVISGSKPTPRPNTTTNDYRTTGTDTEMQLCELYFPKLKLDNNTSTVDGMNRPAQTWMLNGESIATSAATPTWSTVVTKGQTAEKLVGDHNSNWTKTGSIASINGNTKTAADAASLLVGDVVEVYLDPAATTTAKVSAIVVTRYDVDEVTGSVVTRGSGSSLEVRIPGFVGYTAASKLDGDYSDLAKDDVIYYYEDNDGVYHFAKADSFEGTLTGTKSGGYIINGETRYINGKVSTIASVSVTPVYNTTYEYFTDPNGYLIAAKAVEEATGSSDYVVIDQIVYVPGDGSIAGSKYVEAKLVKMDGTTEIVKINSVKLNATKYVGVDTADRNDDANGYVIGTSGDKRLVWDLNTATGTTTLSLASDVFNKTKKAFFTYSEGSDGYDLTEVVPATGVNVGHIKNNASDTAGNEEIKNGAATVNGGIAVNRNTVFVVGTGSGSYTVYTGNNNVPSMILTSAQADNTAYVTRNGIATHIYVAGVASSSVSGETIFILSASADRFAVEKDSRGNNMSVLYYKAIVGGEATEIKVAANSSTKEHALTSGTVAVGAFEPTYNSEGVITKLSGAKDAGVKAGYIMSAGTLKVGTNTVYTVEDDTSVFLVDNKLNVDVNTAGDMDGSRDDNDRVYVVTKGTNKVDYAVIFSKDEKGQTTVTEANQSGTAATVTATISTNADDKEQEIILTGTVVSGVNTDAQATMGNITSVAGKEFTIVKFTLPSYLKISGIAVKQTNDALKEYYNTDPNVSENVKFRASQDLSSETEFMLMVMVGKTATLEFDVAGCTNKDNFKADYTFTFDGTGLKAGS